MTTDYECPMCQQWVEGQRRLKDHLLDAHAMVKRAHLKDRPTDEEGWE